ncbi:hypothetical protein ACFYOG_37105 [Streptomyces sp. NPDC007818]|uniref:hypothetical protein n=1 Tax=Streptomyces sp. NPDC007818 TaxID=3364780 RepID=UPI00367D5861
MPALHLHLRLHLLWSSLVRVNTFLCQQVLAEPEWVRGMSVEVRRGLIALFWSSVDLYGCFRLDIASRPDLGLLVRVPGWRSTGP